MNTTEILTGIKNWVVGKLVLKQDVISDLAAIRSGSAAGATAVQPADLSAYFNGAAYDGNTKRINFYHGQTVVAYIDATAFVIDGMVDDVRIENGYLIIDFNTASDKQDISIPLTDIFDPSNYYNKTQTDTLLGNKVDKVTGKGLSTNDYTNAEKEKLSGLQNYDDTQVRQLISQKQDIIQDLDTIRSGASAGATAVQPSVMDTALANTVAESGVYDVTANSNNAKFASLSALLSSENIDTLIPSAKRKGGMSIKFVLSSDNKYIQTRLMADEFTTDTTQWATAEEGVYVENPEFVYVKTDAEGKILWAIKADGGIYYGAGVPQQVVDYINERIAELSLDEYEDIVAFLNNLEKGDKTLQTLFDEKVDKEEGKSLIDAEYASSQSAIENPEYIEAKTDSEGKLLAGRTTDGAAFENVGFSTPKISIEGHTIENIEDPEGRSEITTDAEGKVISYRDSDGVKHEEVGINVNHLELGIKAVSELASYLRSKNYIGTNDYSYKSEIQIAEPNLAVMNITNIMSMPTAKGTDGHAIVEVWDGYGNYFKKKAIIDAQGNSSLSHAKKNFALDFCEDDWEGDKTTSITIGKWVTQDSFHFKAYYYDFFDGIPVIGYQWYDEIVKTRGVRYDRCWKRALLPSDIEIGNTNVGMAGDDYSLLLDTGARCFPDGFPVLVYLNGDFYGIFCWQLKKHRDNYHQIKDNGKNIHLDGNICPALLWITDGTIDWFKWAGITPESSQVLNYDGIEIRNPKSMVMRDGNTYDQDRIKALGNSATIQNVEPLGGTDAEYETIVAEAEAIIDSKKRKKRLAAIAYTIEAKTYLLSLTEIIPHLKSMETGGSTAADIRAYMESKFDVDSLIDFQIFSDVCANTDGAKKNWQWNTWDGKKWACSPYDLDWTFGLRGSYSDQEPLTEHLEGTNKDLPCYWVITYFSTELEARYAELRQAGIVDGEHLASNLNNWTLRVGFVNYKKELNKWPDRRDDNIYRFRNWCIKSVQNMDIVYHFNN